MGDDAFRMLNMKPPGVMGTGRLTIVAKLGGRRSYAGLEVAVSIALRLYARAIG
jgi:hypothetical protein